MPVRDVRIVGGGIAGVMTGLELLAGRHAGDYEVTIYEREAAAHTTLCGEGISHNTLTRFTAFDGLPYAAEAFPGAAWYFPGDVRIDVDQKCYTMARERWIPAMAEAFEKHGGTYKTGVKVTEAQVRDMAREADLVIGADGPGSRVAKMIGAERRTLLGIQYRVSPDGYETDRLEFYTDKRFSPEYSWIFPRKDMHNVGLLAQGDGRDWERLDRFMEEKGVGGKVLKREAYPIGFTGTKVQDGNVALIGDAAGLTNPVTKGGMAAIVYAAEMLAECLANNELHRYQERIFSHPLTDPGLQRAVEIIRDWTNEDFERLTRFAPGRMQAAEGSNARRRYALPLAATLITRPRQARDLLLLARAMAISRQYSW